MDRYTLRKRGLNQLFYKLHRPYSGKTGRSIAVMSSLKALFVALALVFFFGIFLFGLPHGADKVPAQQLKPYVGVVVENDSSETIECNYTISIGFETPEQAASRFISLDKGASWLNILPSTSWWIFAQDVGDYHFVVIYRIKGMDSAYGIKSFTRSELQQKVHAYVFDSDLQGLRLRAEAEKSASGSTQVVASPKKE